MHKIKEFLIKITRLIGWIFLSLKKKKENEVLILSNKKKHWFLGYYDVLLKRNSELFFHEVDIKEKKIPSKCKIMSINLQTMKTHKIANSQAVNWQLGSRLQIHGNDLVFNDCVSNKLCHYIYNLNKKDYIFCDTPFWSKNIKLNLTFTLDFGRLFQERPGYGYRGQMRSDLRDTLAILNYDCSEVLYLFHINQICSELSLPKNGYLNHIITNNDCSKIITTYNINKNGKRIVFPILLSISDLSLSTFDAGSTFSHPTFINQNKIFFFDGKGYVIIDLTNQIKKYLYKTKKDGHPTYIGKKHFITDTYPDKFSKMSIYEYKNGKIKNIFDHLNPPNYYGDNRCDFHPRVYKNSIILDLPYFSGRAIGVKSF